MASHIESIVDCRPPTCPWRVFYEPLVSEVIELAGHVDSGMGPTALGDDPPAILLDGIRVYLRARNITQVHDLEEENKQRKAKA